MIWGDFLLLPKPLNIRLLGITGTGIEDSTKNTVGAVLKRQNRALLMMGLEGQDRGISIRKTAEESQ